MKLRVVFDSTTVISALCFPRGRLRWLVQHWRGAECRPVVSRTTAAELTRVLAYPKLRLAPDVRYEFLADYLPFCEFVEAVKPCATLCRDPRDQPFLDLAKTAGVDVLVSGDSDLLAVAGQTEFAIETPEAYRQRVAQSEEAPPR